MTKIEKLKKPKIGIKLHFLVVLLQQGTAPPRPARPRWVLLFFTTAQ